MSSTTCTIHSTQRPDKAIYLSTDLIRTLKLAKSKIVNLSFGSKTITTNVRAVKRPGNHIYMPQSVMSAIKLPGPGSCMVHSLSTKELRVGPLIGVLTSGSFNGSVAKAFLSASGKRAIAFAFTPNDVNWQTETVNGYFLSGTGTVTRRTVPLPDVVYNRLANRALEKTESVFNLKDRFVKRNIPLFNWTFFDKADVYRLLEGADASKYVPESINNPTQEEIKQLLEKHKFLYLKPTGGSLGIGIYRLTYSPTRGYFARYRSQGKNVLLRFAKFEGLMNLFRSRTKFTNYVAQQGIRLIEIDTCPIDFRFHLTKNGDNEWVVAAIGAKKAGKGSVTTHIRNGGVLMTPEQALRQTFGLKAQSVLDRAKETTISLAQDMEKNYKHRLGELGFDIGIDQNEKIWMFEANAKPGRSIFKHPSLKADGQQSLINLVEYCSYLARFNVRRDS